MNSLKLIPVLFTMPALSMPMAFAADSHGCNQQFDDAQRLACYDAAFGKPVRPASAPAPAAAPTTAVVPAAAAPATAAVTVPAVAAVAPPPAPPAAPAKPAKAPDVSGASVITSLGRRANGRFVATLENGTVWSQLEPDSTLMIKVGDAVTIRKGVFGSYMLVTQKGATTRVDLVK
jgi:biotin carboxyl carrier protein